MTITLQPRLLQWARQRAGLSEEELALKFSKKDADRWLEKVEEWEHDGELTYKQAEKLARVTHTPFGYLFSSKPPAEKLPIPDFRRLHDAETGAISPDLREVIYQSQRRQEWYREHLLEQEEEALSFIGKFPVSLDKAYITKVADHIRNTLSYTPSDSKHSNLSSILGEFSDRVEACGILVVRAGKVGNNTRRTLNPDEFRGFALVDSYAPLIFINSADTKAAQIFTMAHELAHIWAGESALSNLSNTFAPEWQLEQYCNAVAAEYLMPLKNLKQVLPPSSEINREILRNLRLTFRVSELVALRRLLDAGYISKTAFKSMYADWLDEYQNKGSKSSGGSYHNNQPLQVGKRFGEALVTSTLEGKTQYREAYDLLDMKKQSAFNTFAEKLGIKH